MNTVSPASELSPASTSKANTCVLADLIKYDQSHRYFLHCLSNDLSSGFAAEAPVNALQTLSTQDAAYKPNIEEDKVVSANGDFVGQKISF